MTNGKPVFFYTARAWNDPFQLDEFSQAVGAFCRNPQQRFLNWSAAFRALADQTCDARKVIVIDEFQYIAKERPSILSELQVLWDEELSRKNIFLILCGSAVSFIAKEVLGENTIVAGMVNDEPGVWVSMEIEGDDYWLLIRSDLLDPPFGTAWIWWAFVAFLVGTMGATVLTQRTVRPLAELSAAAKKLGRGEKPDPLPENTRTAEIEAVNRSFNHMVEELERMEDDRELLLAGVSHDLRTPLTRMRLEIELSNLSEDSRDAMVSDLEQMESIVNQFMAYAKRSKQPLERVDLGAAVYGTIDDMRLRTKDDVRIETSIMGNLFVMAHPTELVRAIQNLLVNADRYGRTQENGLLDLNIQVLRQGEEAVLRICDKGVGIPQEEMDRVVRPFERGDTARGGAKGAGLGLAIVVRVVKRSGGRIILSSNHPHGLIVELIMPLANKRNEKPALEEQTAPTDTLLPRQDP